MIEGYPAEEAGLQGGDRIISINNKKIVIYRDITLWTMFNEGKRADVVYERDGELYRTSITPKFSTADQRFLFGSFIRYDKGAFQHFFRFGYPFFIVTVYDRYDIPFFHRIRSFL